MIARDNKIWFLIIWKQPLTSDTEHSPDRSSPSTGAKTGVPATKSSPPELAGFRAGNLSPELPLRNRLRHTVSHPTTTPAGIASEAPSDRTAEATSTRRFHRGALSARTESPSVLWAGERPTAGGGSGFQSRPSTGSGKRRRKVSSRAMVRWRGMSGSSDLAVVNFCSLGFQFDRWRRSRAEKSRADKLTSEPEKSRTRTDQSVSTSKVQSIFFFSFFII